MNIAGRSKRSHNVTAAMEKSHPTSMRPPMLRRTLTALVLVAIGLPGIIYGGVYYFVLITIFLVGSAWEYVRLYRAVQYEPNEIITAGGVLAIATARVFLVEGTMILFAALILLAMTVHLVTFERGRDQAALDFCVTVAGIVYIGWLCF